MGMPSEIFEPCSDFLGGGPGTDNRQQDAARTVKLSTTVMESFPDAKPIKVGPKTMRISSPACRPVKIRNRKVRRFSIVNFGNVLAINVSKYF